ncbi:MAG: hypothetical protein ACE5OR_08910, partial [bacterium]
LPDLIGVVSLEASQQFLFTLQLWGRIAPLGEQPGLGTLLNLPGPTSPSFFRMLMSLRTLLWGASSFRAMAI